MTGSALLLRRRIGPLRHQRTFETAKVRELRALEHAGGRWYDNTGLTPASLAFDDGARTHRSAGALDEAEAKHVALRLREAIR